MTDTAALSGQPLRRPLRNDGFLGDIPSDWTTGAFRYYVQVREGQVDPKDAAIEGLDLIAPNHVESGTGRLLALETAADQGAESGKYLCDAGDVIYSKIRPALRKVAVAPHDCLCSADMYPLKGQNGLTNRFLYWYLLSEPFSDFAHRESARVAMPKLNRETLATALVPVPGIQEQERIANFLDVQTGRIDALIAEKDRLSTHLTQSSVDLLHDAVTKGLDRTSLRASGRDWIGDMPAHWSAPYVRFVARLESGHTPSRQHPEYWVDCNIPWFSLADVWQIRDGRREFVTETSEMVSELGLANSSARLLPAGTVMLSRTASVGFSAVMGVPMATTQDFVNWVCGPKVLPEYLLYVFRSMSAEFERLKFGSTHATIYMPDVAKFSMPLPPLEEQRAIVHAARTMKAKMDELRELASAEAERLREYRSSLISAAVTGALNIAA